MKIGILVYSGDAETIFNAFRLARLGQGEGDDVSVFMIGKGLLCEELDDGRFRIKDAISSFASAGGKVCVCGDCRRLGQLEEEWYEPMSTKELYRLGKECERLITF